MWQEWPIVFGGITVGILIITYFARQYLTREEHAEFKQHVETILMRLAEASERRVSIEHFDKTIVDMKRAVDKAEEALEARIEDVKFYIKEIVRLPPQDK